MSDITEITQLVLKERQGRDRGWWEQMEACFHPDSLVHLSWIHATGAEFVTRSRQMRNAGGVRPVHRTSPPVVHTQGRRALVELPVAAEVRTIAHGVEVDLTSFMRLLYRAEKRDESWKISHMTCIYERDTLVPALHGSVLELDKKRMEQFRMPYRCLAYYFSLTGRPVGDDLYGDDQPEHLDELYAAAFEWLHQSSDRNTP